MIQLSTNRCADIDSFCQLLTNVTTSSSSVEFSSSLSLYSSTPLSFPATTTVSMMLTYESSIITIEETSVPPYVTSTLLLFKPSDQNQRWKTIMAIIIPSICILIFSLPIVYILKRKKRNQCDENLKMKQNILHDIDQ